jgi:hypothetical protein
VATSDVVASYLSIADQTLAAWAFEIEARLDAARISTASSKGDCLYSILPVFSCIVAPQIAVYKPRRLPFLR